MRSRDAAERAETGRRQTVGCWPAGAARGGAWLRLVWIAAALVTIFASGVVFLFSGSAVECGETDEAGPTQLRCEFDVAAEPQTVWETFTRTDEPQPHYFDAVLEAEMRPGGRWRFVTDNRQRLLAGGVILELEPPRRFVQSFAAADLEDPPSRISVELRPISGGTRVLLVHDGFAGRTTTYRRFRHAHPLALSALKSLLETGRLPIRARLYTAIFKPGMKLATKHAEPWD